MDTLHVIAGVVKNKAEQILVARRFFHQHQGGLLEFSGGKKRPDESPFQALQREFAEEIGIQIEQARPLIQIPHHYPDKSILLDVWAVEQWSGQAHGREGQEIFWLSLADLKPDDFPAANRAILTALQLPQHYFITPDPSDFGRKFWYQLEKTLESIHLVQFRAKSLNNINYARYAAKIRRLCDDHACRLLLNHSPQTVASIAAHGLHLTAQQLMQWQGDELAGHYLLAASCHNATELERGNAFLDFAVLSPVKQTASHPNTQPLGWWQFQQWAQQAHYPVYALGGLHRQDLHCAIAHGAQGIAAIHGLWA